MNQKACTVLEFDKITRLVAQHASSAPGRAKCEALLPCEEQPDAVRMLQENADAMRRMEGNGKPHFAANTDMSGVLASLAIGATLDQKTLLQTAAFLECAERARAYGITDADRSHTDTLSDLFHALQPLSGVAAEIRRIVLSEDELAPDASPALKEIRRTKASAESKIRETLNKMVNGSLREYLQDTVVTMRGDRYCLPVRAEHKAKVNGIVHDQSSSGSTFFIEPAQVVELNNKIRTCEMEEQQEIARILAALSAQLGEQADHLEANAEYMTALDFIFARASYAQETDAHIPSFTQDRSFILRAARHPLLDKNKAVPVDIWLGKTPEEASVPDVFRMLVITGPNTGGKTVTLKTTGLLTLMGQAGLAIPAESGSTLAWFREIHADIGDEQSIEQSLSTFSAHMTNTVRILQETTEEDLCLFDELGAGTDPTEGAALAIAILQDLLKRGTAVMATTHYAELKVFAMTTEGVKNASCEFDIRTLKPTYRLLIGTPGMSNAFAIAGKLGLPAHIIRNAGEQIDVDKARMETLFTDLEQTRRLADEERKRAGEYREEAQALREKLREQEQKLDARAGAVLEQARTDAEQILADAKRFADEAIRTLRHAGADDAQLREMERTRTKLNERLSDAREKKKAASGGTGTGKDAHFRPEALLPGTPVHIVSMNLNGTVEGRPDRDGNVFVLCGVMRMKVSVQDLTQPEEEDRYSGKEIAKRFSMKRAFADAQGKERKNTAHGKNAQGIRQAPAYELNLIGKNTDDAISALDKYLDDAYLAHVPSVRIVHGKGTGTLRNAVQKHLKHVKYVKSYQTGEYGEGDAGVTIVKLKG